MYVLVSVSQCRHLYEKLSEPEEEVLPELFLTDIATYVLVGGRNDPDIYLNRFGAPKGMDKPALHDPEQLALDEEGHVFHLVYKDSPPVCSLEKAHLLPVSSGEGPSLMAE